MCKLNLTSLIIDDLTALGGWGLFGAPPSVPRRPRRLLDRALQYVLRIIARECDGLRHLKAFAMMAGRADERAR